jgi:hypothetical protein
MKSVERALSGWPGRVALAMFAVAAIAGVVVLVVKLAPEWLASTDGLSRKDAADEVGRVRTALLAVLAGGIATVGAVYTARSYSLNRQGQITERFTRAVDQLGHTAIDVRLGGIYALERIARDSSADHGPVVEVLTAYVREHAPWRGATVPASGEERLEDLPSRDVADAETHRPATDVQAAVSVLARRRVAADEQRLDLSYVDLRGANLYGAQLDSAILVGSHLEGADLERAYLRGASLSKAHLEDALLVRAHLVGAVLSRAHLEGARLVQADLRNAYLMAAHLEGARVAGADLRSAQLNGAHLDDASLSDADLERAELAEASYTDGTVWPEGFDPRARGARRRE